MRTLLLFPFLVFTLSGQSFPRYDFTFSGGTAWDAGNGPGDTSVSLGATGGYRVTRWFEVEGGVMSGLNPLKADCVAAGCETPSSHYIWVPFGARVIVPFAEDRFECSVGGGGLYEHFATTGTFHGGPYSYDGFGGYIKSSVAVALDRHRHFWIGMTPRIFLANGSNARDRWVLLTGDLGFRF